jgi:hypothetical protein
MVYNLATALLESRAMTTYFRSLQPGIIVPIIVFTLGSLCALLSRCGGVHTPLPVPRPATAVVFVRVSPPPVFPPEPSPVPTPPIQRGSGRGFVSITP